MEAYLLDWLNLLLRWAHVIVGIAWIGASFYFIWLDDRLEPSRDPRLAGELWAIHGGGFYRAEKYKLGPAQLPATLHWFKWEAYWTWITGFALLVLMYYVNAELYLIDPTVMPLSKGAAIGIGIGTLVLSLAVYEGLCRSPLDERALAIVLLGFLAAAAWGLMQIFSGRGAFIHYGAILGTIMSANVLHVIIPGQRRMVEAVSEGREPDPKDGAMGKQRSVHNTYFTLPVVFAMISNHHAMTFGHRWSWLLLVAMTLAGALIRVWFVLRHKGRAPAWVWIAGVAAIAVAAWLIAPKTETAGAAVPLSEVQKVIEARCVACHAQKPSFQGLAEAPKGVMLDTPERIRAQVVQIRQQAVLTRAMPPGNLTQMSEEERSLLGRWAAAR
ncbi:MAG: urate hydroxylase PuuD [Betaproteobacteria bacterium]|nr:MAG: urate hydroxylase PuuD [Betaproteobacteria bacterium]